MSETLIAATKYHQERRFADAEKLYREYLGKYPANGKVWMALAHACYLQGRVAESIECLEKARQIEPSDPEIHYTLGNLYAETHQNTQAVICYRNAIDLKSDHGGAWLNLGYIHYHSQNFAAAIESFSEAAKLNTQDAKAFHNLGLALMRAGRAAEADPMLRRAAKLAPDNAAIHTCVMFNMHNIVGLTNQEIYDEHLQWTRRFATEPSIHDDKTSVSRQATENIIRVGYLSPDFRKHSVFYFIHPILKAHNRAVVACYGYSDVERPDEATGRLMEAADHWRDISRLDDQQVFQLIQQDEIDILVDLAGHTYRNRLRMLSRKPAPVQVSWLGYPDTTGLRTMDYRLTDAQADPEGSSDTFYTEKLVRLERGFLCYEPPADAPDPVETPAIKNGFVTFGSFNNLAKVNEQIIHAWSEILQRTPGSVLVLKAPGLGDESGRTTVLSGFQRHGIQTGRIECLGHMVGMNQHLAAYHRVDIALDTFPYNGTTTTCEALWMGIPVITFTGDRHASRMGTSILTSVGLADCIAHGYDAYIDIAVRFGHDLERLAGIREGLRERIRTSPLMDTKNFCRILESEYRKMLV